METLYRKGNYESECNRTFFKNKPVMGFTQFEITEIYYD